MNTHFLPQNKISLDKYDEFIFVSPHLDDAVLSCGFLLSKLKESKRRITIITVFTKCTKSPPTLQAKSFIEGCGYKSGLKLFKDRIRENAAVLKILRARGVNLRFIDAAWRVDSKRRPIYKSASIQFSGRVSEKDNKTKRNLISQLEKYLLKDRVLVFAPLGVGKHADHILVNSVVKKLTNNVIFWEDYPYNLRTKKRERLFSIIKHKFLFSLSENNFSEKEKLIRHYRSQITSLFPNQIISSKAERYFISRNSKFV